MLESIEIMKMLWTEPLVTFEGVYYKLKDCCCRLKPVQKPHPPLWVGAHGPHMLEITGKFGDGWLGDGFASEYKDSLSKIKRAAKECGRDPEEITPARLEFTSIARDHETAARYLPRPHWFGGWEEMTEEEMSEAMAKLERERISGGPDEYIEGIDECVDCGAELVEELPDEISYDKIRVKWKPLQSLPGRIYAEMAKEVFDKKGIPSLIQSSFFSSAYGTRGVFGDKTTILVPEDRLEECTEIINQMFNHI